MSAQAGVGFSQHPLVRLCIRLDSFQITGLHVEELKVLDRSLSLMQVYAPNAMSKYQTFVYEVNDALLRVSPTESAALMGDFNAHVGTDT